MDVCVGVGAYASVNWADSARAEAATDTSRRRRGTEAARDGDGTRGDKEAKRQPRTRESRSRSQREQTGNGPTRVACNEQAGDESEGAWRRGCGRDGRLRSWSARSRRRATGSAWPSASQRQADAAAVEWPAEGPSAVVRWSNYRSELLIVNSTCCTTSLRLPNASSRR